MHETKAYDNCDQNRQPNFLHLGSKQSDPLSCQVNGAPFVGCDAGMPFMLLGLQQGLQTLVIQVTDVGGVSSVSAPYQ